MVQPELWAAAALMLLGAAVSLCIRCQRSATKRQTRLSQRRSQLESQQRFAVIRSRAGGSALPKDSAGSSHQTPLQAFHPSPTKALNCTLQCGGRGMAPKSTATRRLEQIKEPENLPIARKAIEELSDSHHAGYGSREESRYQNFLAENCLQEETAYVEPISFGHYHSCTKIFSPPQGRSPEKDEDSYSYENVIIGASQGSDSDDAVDYENSTAIHTWKLQQGQGQASPTESLDDEPDYINTGPMSGPALLSQQSILHEV